MLGAEKDFPRARSDNRRTRSRLTGRIVAGFSDKSFCFIAVEGEQSIFCHKSELPSGVSDGDEVIFDARPSYDKKKGQESWKASNVRCTMSLASN